MKEIGSDMLILNKIAQKIIIQTEREFYPAFSVCSTQQSAEKDLEKKFFDFKGQKPPQGSYQPSAGISRCWEPSAGIPLDVGMRDNS